MSKAQILHKRSQFLRQLRAFFYARDVIEVDTPILSRGATPDVHLRSLSSKVQIPGEKHSQTFYLHTSPEYPMKRLLCEGVGDCFYLGKVFRDGDLSPRHQVEFSMLEWYRLGFSLEQLIDEVLELLQTVLASSDLKVHQVERISYQQAFAKYAQIEDIFAASAAKCREVLQTYQVPEIVGVDSQDKPLWEQLVMTEVIEPQLGIDGISVIFDFPARDAALARLSSENSDCAQRFEVFVNAMELANGYYELADSQEYRLRFTEALATRAAYDFPSVPLDDRLLQALEHQGLPECSGVALGVDRLFALQQQLDNIADGIAFGIEQA